MRLSEEGTVRVTLDHQTNDMFMVLSDFDGEEEPLKIILTIESAQMIVDCLQTVIEHLEK